MKKIKEKYYRAKNINQIAVDFILDSLSVFVKDVTMRCHGYAKQRKLNIRKRVKDDFPDDIVKSLPF